MKRFLAFLGICVALFCGVVHTAAAFPGVVSATIVPPIEPVDAIEPPPAPVDLKDHPLPPAYKPKPVPQRVQPVGADAFMILPQDAPLPHGTISPDLLEQETVVQGPAAQPSSTGGQSAKIAAKLLKTPEGQMIIRLTGLSQGKAMVSLHEQMKAAQAEEATATAATAASSTVSAAQKKVPPSVKKQPKPKKKEPTVLRLHLTYLADQVHPEDVTALARFLVQAKKGDIQHLALTVQHTPLPFALDDTLPQERWQWLNTRLTEAGLSFKGVRTSEIMLTHTDNQFLDIELTLSPE